MMPRYDFQCGECKTVLTDQFLRITHLPDEIPECCDEPMGYHITQPPMVHWKDPVIEPFRAVATKDRPLITTAAQNREYMAKNDLVDANEVFAGPPPTHKDQEKVNADAQADIDAMIPDDPQLLDAIKQQGIDNILGDE